MKESGSKASSSVSSLRVASAVGRALFTRIGGATQLSPPPRTDVNQSLLIGRHDLLELAVHEVVLLDVLLYVF